jgi:hypothetical protein
MLLSAHSSSPRRVLGLLDPEDEGTMILSKGTTPPSYFLLVLLVYYS